MADSYLLTGPGTPWRIPGQVPASSSVPEWENRCDDENCPGPSAHAPDQTLKLSDGNPLERLLRLPKGGH